MNSWVQIDEEKVAKFKFTDDAVAFAEKLDREPRYKGAVQAFWFGQFCEKPQRIYPEEAPHDSSPKG
jgi:hypothetical protein